MKNSESKFEKEIYLKKKHNFLKNIGQTFVVSSLFPPSSVISAIMAFRRIDIKHTEIIFLNTQIYFLQPH